MIGEHQSNCIEVVMLFDLKTIEKLKAIIFKLSYEFVRPEVKTMLTGWSEISVSEKTDEYEKELLRAIFSLCFF